MNNAVSATNSNLPTNIEDLSKFVLIGREKLVSVRAEIRAIDKVGLAEEVRKQKLEEAQAISEAVLDAEVRIGELMSQIPKATPNNNPFHENDSDVELVKKADVTMQAYVDENENFLSVGIAKTTDVMEFVEKGYARQNHTGKHQIGQAAFYVCRWDEMVSKGYKVLIWQMNRT